MSQSIKFYYGLPASGSSYVAGGIYFDETNHTIRVAKTDSTYVDYYGGNVKGASFTNNVLKLSLFSGSDITVDLASLLSTKVDKVAGKGLSTNDYTNDDKDKLAGVAKGAQVNVIESVKVNGTDLKISNKAVDVIIPSAKVDGIAADDKILALNNKLLSAAVSLSYDKDKKEIYLIGKDGKTAISTISAADFVKDGMLDSVDLVKASSDNKVNGKDSGTFLKFTFNTDANKTTIYVDVTDLIDVYSAGSGLKLTGKVFSVDTSVIATKDSVDTLSDTVTSINTTVTKLDDAVTVEGSVKKQIKDASDALDTKITAAKNAADAAKTSADAKIASVAGDTYITATTTSGAVKLATKTSTVASDTAGLADAKDVKSYVDRAVSDKNIGVSSFGGKTGAITLAAASTTKGDINLAMTGNELKATIVGLGSAAYTAAGDYATAAQGTKADSALQSASGDTYVSASVSANKVSVAATSTLTDAVGKANSALQSITSNNDCLTVSAKSAAGAVTLDLVWASWPNA